LRRWRGALGGLTVRVGNAINRIVLGLTGGAVAQLGARLDGIEEVVGSNPIGSTNVSRSYWSCLPCSNL
jgi:hypothetical protein